ncbi:hypothetical protein K0C01_10650 [Salinarchaeum sp. IM2453]|uniref:hypothetical protein n=1 Tax=Salinarchaeum sp. IM2453 TaxID=2862870 RepID=UPI001C831DFB|nr:hypothetical protein [Salinarchaeum sp. IM2453]QZA88234.1 hypothetical protein K0C01_10650 [Salinarchaeum sp. IM2453]
MVVAKEAFKYAATPEYAETATAAWTDIQTCKEVYNYTLTQEYWPRLGLEKLGVKATAQTVGQGMAESVPAETVLSGNTKVTANDVSPKRVVEPEIPFLKDPPTAASRQGQLT